MTVRILVGDALARLADLPDGSVHCCVTSPPYWGLRSYKGDDGMIGLEPTFEAHLENLVAVFREVRRVLRDDGTMWLNYGDAYAGSWGNYHPTGKGGQRKKETERWERPGYADTADLRPPASRPQNGLKPKDLMMMPARVAMALQADGWWLRSEIIWHKPNPMPESCRDRPTSAHEKVFLLSKSARYFYDAEAVRVARQESTMARYKHAHNVGSRKPDRLTRGYEGYVDKFDRDDPTANLRNVWTIATHSYKGAHFATFPPALVEPCIKAGTSEHGACGECGAPWVRVRSPDLGGAIGAAWHDGTDRLGKGQRTEVENEVVCSRRNHRLVALLRLRYRAHSRHRAGPVRRFGNRRAGRGPTAP